MTCSWRTEADFRLLAGTLISSAPAFRDLEHIAQTMPLDFAIVWDLIQKTATVDIDVLFMYLAAAASDCKPGQGNLSGGPTPLPVWLAPRYTSCVVRI